MIPWLIYVALTTSCPSWDVEAYCCPAACAAKSGPGWTKADGILRGCMVGIGCSTNEAATASVFQMCTCK